MTIQTGIPVHPSSDVVGAKVVEMLAQSLKIDSTEVDTAQPLTEYGLDSLDAVVISADMEEWLGVELPTTLLWDCKNVDEVVSFVADNFAALARGEEVRVMS